MIRDWFNMLWFIQLIIVELRDGRDLEGKVRAALNFNPGILPLCVMLTCKNGILSSVLHESSPIILFSNALKKYFILSTSYVDLSPDRKTCLLHGSSIITTYTNNIERLRRSEAANSSRERYLRAKQEQMREVHVLKEGDQGRCFCGCCPSGRKRCQYSLQKSERLNIF